LTKKGISPEGGVTQQRNQKFSVPASLPLLACNWRKNFTPDTLPVATLFIARHFEHVEFLRAGRVYCKARSDWAK